VKVVDVDGSHDQAELGRYNDEVVNGEWIAQIEIETEIEISESCRIIFWEEIIDEPQPCCWWLSFVFFAARQTLSNGVIPVTERRRSLSKTRWRLFS
jgi:hypothetical protein